MQDYDVKLTVELTVRVTASSADKAEWLLRHVLDRRHATDPMAGLALPIYTYPGIERATVMVASFDAREHDVTVEAC